MLITGLPTRKDKLLYGLLQLKWLKNNYFCTFCSSAETRGWVLFTFSLMQIQDQIIKLTVLLLANVILKSFKSGSCQYLLYTHLLVFDSFLFSVGVLHNTKSSKKVSVIMICEAAAVSHIQASVVKISNLIHVVRFVTLQVRKPLRRSGRRDNTSHHINLKRHSQQPADCTSGKKVLFHVQVYTYFYTYLLSTYL